MGLRRHLTGNSFICLLLISIWLVCFENYAHLSFWKGLPGSVRLLSYFVFIVLTTYNHEHEAMIWLGVGDNPPSTVNCEIYGKFIKYKLGKAFLNVQYGECIYYHASFSL